MIEMDRVTEDGELYMNAVISVLRDRGEMKIHRLGKEVASMLGRPRNHEKITAAIHNCTTRSPIWEDEGKVGLMD